MNKPLQRIVNLLFCVFWITVARNSVAEMITLTAEGSFVQGTNPTNLSPFEIPALGTKATFGATLDTSTTFPLQLVNLSFGDQYYSVETLPWWEFNIEHSVRKANDAGSSSAFLSEWYMPSVDGAYIDYLNITVRAESSLIPRPGTLTAFEYGMVFINSSDQLPIAPLTDSDIYPQNSEFVIPDPADWEIAYIYYAAEGWNANFELSQASLHFQIESISATPVPAPPTVWLLGSALLALVRLRKKQSSATKI